MILGRIEDDVDGVAAPRWEHQRLAAGEVLERDEVVIALRWEGDVIVPARVGRGGELPGHEIEGGGSDGEAGKRRVTRVDHTVRVHIAVDRAIDVTGEGRRGAENRPRITAIACRFRITAVDIRTIALPTSTEIVQGRATSIVRVITLR